MVEGRDVHWETESHLELVARRSAATVGDVSALVILQVLRNSAGGPYPLLDILNCGPRYYRW